jgi:hypothetical protein
VAEAGIMSEQDIRATLAQAMNAENRRRQVASDSPGLGALLPLPQPPSGPGVGISDMDLPVTGEGYSTTAPAGGAQTASYGPERPVYADDLVGGVGFQGGFSEPAIESFRFSVSPGLVTPAAPPAQARPGLLSRLRGWLRRH